MTASADMDNGVRRVLFMDSDVARAEIAAAISYARGNTDASWMAIGGSDRATPACAARAAEEAGLLLDPARVISAEALSRMETDVVVVLCHEAEEHFGLLVGRPAMLRWNLGPPPGDDDDDIEEWARAISLIQHITEDLFEYGYLESLFEVRSLSYDILDNISDGIIAHDMSCRVVYMNRAAEEITGRVRAEVLDRDCHSVFEGPFCGMHCSLSDKSSDVADRQSRVEVANAQGERRLLDMRVKSLCNRDGECVGVLNCFRDVTREHRLAKRVGEIESFSGIIGRDKKMLDVFELISDVADTQVPVMIQGESGTGKELVAAAIHNEGPRANERFIQVNCAALPEGLLESELFGHVKGSFTGAVRDKKGRFELADRGTIFLDEIGDVSPAMQVRLLRVLQEGCFERVGSEITLKVDVRVISATNKDLHDEISRGNFREDLYYRLNVVPVWLPPLRDRINDVPLLVRYIYDRFCTDMNRDMVTVSSPAMELMMSYGWPGNVRELQNWLQFSLVKCRGTTILPEHFPAVRSIKLHNEVSLGLRGHLTEDEVRDALIRARGNKVEASRLLGISRATLYRFLKKYMQPDSASK